MATIIMDHIEYPEITDESLYSKLYHKKEFYNMIPHKQLFKHVTKTEQDSLCDGDKPFSLLPHQRLLKLMIRPDTPYQNMLLFHGIGTGKTASAIAIAENYKEYLKLHGSKIYIITPIHEIFFNELVGWDRPRAAGNSYLSDESRDKLKKLDPSSLEYIRIKKETLKRVRQYYAMPEHSQHLFFGYHEFTNRVLNKNIPNLNNSVLIIDEIHRIKNPVQIGSDKKESPYNVILSLLEKSHNVTLLLMSATPIFNDPDELISIINLFKTNLKMELLDPKVLEYNHNKLNYKSKKILKKELKGLVSYVKGNNPITFPKKIEMGMIPDFMKYTKIISCPMSSYQTKIYMDVFLSESNFQWKTSSSHALNMVYPGELYGKDGFDKYFTFKSHKLKILPGKSRDFLKYKPETVSMDITAINETHGLRNYSSKLFELIHIIKSDQRPGPVFVYTQNVKFDGMAIVYFALLENNIGPVRYVYSGTPLNLRESIINTYNSPENIDGSLIKVLIGSKSLEVGITLNNTVKTFILDPHWNLSSPDSQVVGRTIRHCSHSDLPLDQQYVNVYKLTANMPSNTVQNTQDVQDDYIQNGRILTVDEKKYQIAENKDIRIAALTRLLKESAIDCMFLRSQNIIPDRFTKDIDFTRDCEYVKCKYSCAIQTPKLRPDVIDYSTYNIMHSPLFFMKQQIVDAIKKLFKINTGYKLKDLLAKLYSRFVNENPLFLKDTDEFYNVSYIILTELIDDRIPVVNMHGQPGFITFYKNFYMFNPIHQNTDISFYKRSLKPDVTVDYININDLLNDELFIEPKKKVLKHPKIKDTSQTKYTNLSKPKTLFENKYRGCIDEQSNFKIITKSNIVYNEDGSVNIDASKLRYKKFDAETGKRELHPNSIPKGSSCLFSSATFSLKILLNIAEEIGVDMSQVSKNKKEICNAIERKLYETGDLYSPCINPKDPDYADELSKFELYE